MPVQWRVPTRRPQGPGFVDLRRKQCVIPLCSCREYPVIRLHRWVEQFKGSFPCLGEGECKCHETITCDYAYAPVLCYNLFTKDWEQKILAVGSPTSPLGTKDVQGQQLVIEREKHPENRGTVLPLGIRTPLLPAPTFEIAPFDVRPHLLRRWGLFKEADLIGCEFHEAEMLPFPESDVG